jgi:hypothetical protein
MWFDSTPPIDYQKKKIKFFLCYSFFFFFFFFSTQLTYSFIFPCILGIEYIVYILCICFVSFFFGSPFGYLLSFFMLMHKNIFFHVDAQMFMLNNLELPI